MDAPPFDPIRHRRGGRKRKPENDRASCVLRIRITTEKYWQFFARAAEANMTLSAYGRATFENNPVRVRVVPGAPAEVMRELRIMGRNLWQAIEDGRRYGFSDRERQALELAAETISNELRRLLYGLPTEPPSDPSSCHACAKSTPG
jgi:hypothetical protein